MYLYLRVKKIEIGKKEKSIKKKIYIVFEIRV